MKRDKELMLRILKYLEAPDGRDYDEEKHLTALPGMWYNLQLCADLGLVRRSDRHPITEGGVSIYNAVLTFKGHDVVEGLVKL